MSAATATGALSFSGSAHLLHPEAVNARKQRREVRQMGKISDELKRKLEADPNDVDAIVQAIAQLEDQRDSGLAEARRVVGL